MRPCVHDAVCDGRGWRCTRCGNALDNPLGITQVSVSPTLTGQQLYKQMGDIPRWDTLPQDARDRWEEIAAMRHSRQATPTQAAERPIEVGDYVRWERGPSMPWNWVEGEVMDIVPWSVKITIHAQTPGRLAKIGDQPWLRIERHNGCTIRRIPRPVEPAIDPLDVKYDGTSLALLLHDDTIASDETHRDHLVGRSARHLWKPSQRAAVSAHWSAELRAKVAASDAQRKAREVSVLCQGDYDDYEPWGPR